MNNKTIIISLGGSLIVPDAIDWQFIKKFKQVIEEGIKNGFRFIIVTGGGRTARKYIEATKKPLGKFRRAFKFSKKLSNHCPNKFL